MKHFDAEEMSSLARFLARYFRSFWYRCQAKYIPLSGLEEQDDSGGIVVPAV